METGKQGNTETLECKKERRVAMPTTFCDVEEVFGFMIEACDLGEELTVFEEIDNLKLGGFELSWLDRPDIDEIVKDQIRASLAEQRSFEMVSPKGSLLFSVCPTGRGFFCWIKNEKGLIKRI